MASPDLPHQGVSRVAEAASASEESGHDAGAATSSAPTGPRWSSTDDDLTLEKLANLHLEMLELSERLNQLAKRLHLDGHSWSAIGGAVGISGQAAHQRWTIKGKRAHAERQRRRTHREDEERPEPTSRPEGPTA